jgi:hypothetical protein
MSAGMSTGSARADVRLVRQVQAEILQDFVKAPLGKGGGQGSVVPVIKHFGAQEIAAPASCGADRGLILRPVIDWFADVAESWSSALLPTGLAIEDFTANPVALAPSSGGKNGIHGHRRNAVLTGNVERVYASERRRENGGVALIDIVVTRGGSSHR